MDDIENQAEEQNTKAPNLEDFPIEEALDDATTQLEQDKEEKTTAMQDKAKKKRQVVNEVKKKTGVRKGKQSKFPTRSDDFLGEAVSDRAIHLVLNKNRSEVYKDGADFCPRVMMGIPAFNKPCKKNAFEHLITIQEKIRAKRGDNPAKAPGWIIINNDTSMIMDRNIVSRLEELKPTTAVAGGYGFERIRASGKWYQIDTAIEQEYLRGCYIQANSKNTDWDFIVGHNFKQSPRYQVLIIHSPFIAVRGNFFMQLDFTEMATNVKSGFFHYMADISMECFKQRLTTAQVKTVSAQYENIFDYGEDEDFQHDQSYFTSKWQPFLPASIKSRP